MFNNLNELKNKVIVSDVVSTFITLKKNGSAYVACCPFHNEKSPSFTIHKAKNNWRCFGACQTGGDAIDFVMKFTNCNFIEACEKIAEIYNFTLEVDNKVIVKPTHRLEKLSKDFIHNFENVRKISNNTLLRFNITESVEWMPKAQKVIPVICFNYMRDGELINIKFRGKNKDMLLAKNAELIFYNIDEIKNLDECIIVEGEIDCLSLYEAKFYNCVSVPNGASTKLKYVDNCYEYFLNKKKIIIWVDKDDAGKSLRESLVNRFGKERCYIVASPDDCKDANDVLVKYGVEKVKECVDNAKQLTIEGLATFEDRKAAIYDLYENGMPRGTASGIMGLDDYIRFEGGLLTTITGSPSSGKSEFLDNITSNLAIRENWRIAFFSFENQPTKIHDGKILEKMIGKSFSHRKDAGNRIDKRQLDMALYELYDKFKVIDKTSIDCSLDSILNKTEEMILRYGIKALVIDPYNKIVHNFQGGITETNYINQFLTKITNFANKWDIHIFLVAHPTKLKTENGKMQIPNLYSIAGSANFYNQTDNGFIVHRDRETGIVNIIIEKIRFSEQGQEGWVGFNFDTMTRQYTYNSSKYPIQSNPYTTKTVSSNKIDFSGGYMGNEEPPF